jgi:transposase
MEEYIAFDAHKRYTWVEHEQANTRKIRQYRLEHAPGAIRQALAGCAPGTPVAIEATANWYWITEEIAQAGCVPLLVHPRKAKLMMGGINKTDKLDTHGMNILQRNGTLPTVWIPPGKLRELRELTRTRMVLVAQRTRWKNRISATLAKWGVAASAYSDPYGKGAREELQRRLAGLPEQTRWATQQMLEQLDGLSQQIGEFEKRLEELVEVSAEMQWLLSLPGVGVILAATIALEIGDIARFLSAERLASYSGTTPRVHSSGDRTRYGRTRPDVNRYLKWAFAEAANSTAVNYRRIPERHATESHAEVKRAHK